MLNCCLGDLCFKGGLSLDGGGVTRHLQLKVSDGIQYMDTPGLNDENARAECAREIQKALQLGGEFRIVFVLSLEGGRNLNS